MLCEVDVDESFDLVDVVGCLRAVLKLTWPFPEGGPTCTCKFWKCFSQGHGDFRAANAAHFVSDRPTTPQSLLECARQSVVDSQEQPFCNLAPNAVHLNPLTHTCISEY